MDCDGDGDRDDNNDKYGGADNDNRVHIMVARLTQTNTITNSDNEFGGHDDDDDDDDDNGESNRDDNFVGDEYALSLTMVTGKLLIRPYTLMTLMLLTITMTMLMHEAWRFGQAAHKAVHPRMMMTTAVT